MQDNGCSDDHDRQDIVLLYCERVQVRAHDDATYDHLGDDTGDKRHRQPAEVALARSDAERAEYGNHQGDHHGSSEHAVDLFNGLMALDTWTNAPFSQFVQSRPPRPESRRKRSALDEVDDCASWHVATTSRHATSNVHTVPIIGFRGFLGPERIGGSVRAPAVSPGDEFADDEHRGGEAERDVSVAGSSVGVAAELPVVRPPRVRGLDDPAQPESPWWTAESAWTGWSVRRIGLLIRDCCGACCRRIRIVSARRYHVGG
jgi:hypothetical protein